MHAVWVDVVSKFVRVRMHTTNVRSAMQIRRPSSEDPNR
jgi:hypothetical protein